MLHPHLGEDLVVKERFVREARTAIELRHPAIVDAFELIDVAGTSAIVTEYPDRGDLRSCMPFSWSEAVEVGRTICRALAFAHGRGIVHRNVTPESIYVFADGSFKLGDFGLARINELIGLTTSTLFSGNSEYLAPEIAAGASVDPRSDLYSVGLVLFESVAGTQPELETDADGDVRLTDSSSALLGDSPPWFIDIVEGLLQPLEKRISSAAVAADLLESCSSPKARIVRDCIYCRKTTPDLLPLCVHCGREDIRVRLSKAPDSESLILRKISEEDEIFEDFIFRLRCLAGVRELDVNILTGDIRMYSKEEKKKGMRLPVRIIDNVTPESASLLLEHFLQEHTTKIHIYRRSTNAIRSREKRGPLIAPKQTLEYDPGRLAVLREQLGKTRERNDSPAGDLFETVVESAFAIKSAIAQGQVGVDYREQIDEMFTRVEDLAAECNRTRVLLESVHLGEIYSAVSRAERGIMEGESSSLIDRAIAEKTRLLNDYERYRKNERHLASLISTIATIKEILDHAQSGLTRDASDGERLEVLSDMARAFAATI